MRRPKAKPPAADRYVDTGKALSSFAGEVHVRCVRCDTAGVVTAAWAPYRWDARFRCAGCGLALNSADRDWVGPMRVSGRQRCGQCGGKWLTPAVEYPAPPPMLPARLPAPCPGCGHVTQVEVTVCREFPRDRCCDPHFGLPLRLAVSTRWGKVWAYNALHLAELSGYVSAKLRVRERPNKYSMFWRMPQWMKAAKHREEVEKALRKLVEMY